MAEVPQVPQPYPDNHLFYVDFPPTQLQSGGFVSLPVYEPFANLIVRANEYLRNNPNHKVIQCEGSEKKFNHWQGGVNLDRSTYLEKSQGVAYIRNLRLWCQVTSDPNHSVQQLSYMTVMPACLSQPGIFSLPAYENFGTTIEKLNEAWKSNPLPGKILNVETEDITMMPTWGDFRVDPERTFFMERGRTCYVSCIRIFYIAGPPCYEQIGFADFRPEVTGENSVMFMTIPTFEPFVNVMIRANQWAQQQSTVNFVNVQGLECKFHYRLSGKSFSTQEMFYHDSSRGTSYVSFLRVYYTLMPVDSPFTNPKPLNLTYRTFEPVQLGSLGWNFTEDLPFESQSQTLQRANAWLKQTGAKIISAETFPVRMMSRREANMLGANQYYGSENTYTVESQQANWFLFSMRLYFDGTFVEPPPEALPPAPQVQRYTEQECCKIL